MEKGSHVEESCLQPKNFVPSRVRAGTILIIINFDTYLNNHDFPDPTLPKINKLWPILMIFAHLLCSSFKTFILFHFQRLTD